MKGRIKVSSVYLTALLVSVVVMIGLINVDVTLLSKVRAEEARATRNVSTVMPGGKVSGQDVLNKLVWVPPEDESQDVILFGVADNGDLGDMPYWLDIVSRVRKMNLDTYFTGLCMAKEKCSRSNGLGDGLTILGFTDLALSHTLVTAARDGKAFLYRGTRVRRALTLKKDRQEFAGDIAALSHQINVRMPNVQLKGDRQ